MKNPEEKENDFAPGAESPEMPASDAAWEKDSGETGAVPESDAAAISEKEGSLDLRARDLVFPEEDTFFRGRMHNKVHWSVVWSDLMMTMFIFFVIMYVYVAAHQDFLGGSDLGSDLGTGMGTGVMGDGGGTIGGEGGGPFDNEPGRTAEPEMSASMAQMYDLSKQRLAAEDMKKFASINLAPDQTVRIILTGDLLFDPGQAELKENAKNSLVKIAQLLQQTPYVINVVGHTDSTPIHNDRFASNWELSVVRATRVARFLIESMKLPAKRFFVSGHSFHQPVQKNDTAAHRAANRRVEIVVTKEMPLTSAAGLDKLE